MKGINGDNRGMIALEVLLSFFIFYLISVFVVLFVQMASMQLRVHYALTQTAKEIAVYGYAFDILGVTSALGKVEANASKPRGDLDNVIGNMFSIYDSASAIPDNVSSLDYSGLSGNVSNIRENADSLGSQIGTWANDPSQFFIGMMWVGIQKGIDTGFDYVFASYIAPAVFEKYMRLYDGNNIVVSADQYLRQMRVPNGKNGISFIDWDLSLDALRDGIAAYGAVGSHFLTQGNTDEITIKVMYEMDFYLFRPILGERSKLPVAQEVKIKAWVGDGGSYD